MPKESIDRGARVFLSDAVRRIEIESGKDQATARKTLLKELKLGTVRSAAALYKRKVGSSTTREGVIRYRDETLSDILLSTAHWHQMTLRWENNSAWVDEHASFEGIYVDISTVEQSLFRKNLAPDAVNSTVSEEVFKNRGGRPRYDWDAFHREVIRIANLPDGLPPVQADLERVMLNWCEHHWTRIGESTIREKVAAIYKVLRSSKPSF